MDWALIRKRIAEVDAIPAPAKVGPGPQRAGGTKVLVTFTAAEIDELEDLLKLELGQDLTRDREHGSVTALVRRGALEMLRARKLMGVL